MRFQITIRELLDKVTEHVAIKSGILLSDHDVFELLHESEMKNWLHVLKGEPDKTFAARPEFIEDFVRVLRCQIGNLPDATPPTIHSTQIFKKLLDEGNDPKPVLDAFLEIINSNKYKIIGEDAANEIVNKSKMPKEVVDLVLLALGEHQDRSLNLFFNVESKDWDDAIPLNELFSTETIPSDPNYYLDQRFLDYLVTNTEKLDKMHWRNFERLCAEFFNRLGYKIELGPGTADGGIDIRIWASDESKGPPLLLIQCKRYQEKNKIGIEYVKAFWTDVAYEGAEHGLIATTSYIAPGGKKVSQARGWPLSFAENKEVKQMVQSMWRHAWQGKGKTKGVGEYLLPPILPLE
jgi:restriction system protein